MHLTVIVNQRKPNQRVVAIWPNASESFFQDRFIVGLEEKEDGSCLPRVKFASKDNLPKDFTTRDLMPYHLRPADYLTWAYLTETITYFATNDGGEQDETIEVIVNVSPFD